jgi:hypothetical protein
VLQNFNLIVLSATVASNVWAGRLNRSHVPSMAVVAGTLILPAIWGSKIYVGMSAAAFRKTVLWLGPIGRLRQLHRARSPRMCAPTRPLHARA